MEEGQFENLPGKGKPLNLNTNPHADPAEDTLYRILSKNNCAPEWVELNKEIRSKVAEWRLALKKAWANRCDGDHSKWAESSQALKMQLRDINDKVSNKMLLLFSVPLKPVVELEVASLLLLWCLFDMLVNIVTEHGIKTCFIFLLLGYTMGVHVNCRFSDTI